MALSKSCQLLLILTLAILLILSITLFMQLFYVVAFGGKNLRINGPLFSLFITIYIFF